LMKLDGAAVLLAESVGEWTPGDGCQRGKLRQLGSGGEGHFRRLDGVQARKQQQFLQPCRRRHPLEERGFERVGKEVGTVAEVAEESCEVGSDVEDRARS